MAHSVRPSVLPLTELDARELLAKSLLKLASEHGPTRVGKAIGCDEKTVRNARDEKSTLGLDLAANLLALDPTALNPILRHFGLRAVPLGAACTSDANPAESLSAALHCVTSAQHPNSPDGYEINKGEAKAMLPELYSAQATLSSLIELAEAPEQPRLRGVA